MKKNAFKTHVRRQQQIVEAKLAAKRETSKVKAIAGGRRVVEVSTGTVTFSCPGCGVLVVDSWNGRQGHAQRMPKCRPSMKLD